MDNCRHHPQKEPHCSKFVSDDIIKYTRNDEVSYEKMANFGAIIVFSIN
jgi:hypothetical protein